MDIELEIKQQQSKIAEVTFGTAFTAGNFEHTIEEFRAVIESDSSIVLDLKKVTFIELVSLSLLLGVLRSRLIKGQKTYFRLPHNKKVRTFLRHWRFSEAIYKVFGIPFYFLCTADSRKYFGESNQNESIREINDYSNILPKNMVSLSVYKVDEFKVDSPENLAEKIGSNWQTKNVAKVFDRVFEDSNYSFSVNVVKEAIANCLRHPQSENIVLGSSIFIVKRLQNNNNNKYDGYFNLVIWDDGESILDTIVNRLTEGQRVRNWVHEELANYSYFTRITSDNKLFLEKKIGIDFTPTLEDSESMILFSSILPGISSNPNKPEYLKHNNYENPLYCKPGMGLFLLTKTAVFDFGGSVSIRTKDKFLNIKADKPNKKTKLEGERAFNCKVTEGLSFYKGNLLTIRLPVHVKK